MKKTKKEKLKANIRRQQEFERIKLTLSSQSHQKPKSEKLRETKAEYLQAPTLTKQDETLLNLTNLSYLPKQLVKIGVITLAVILVQILLALTIL